MRVFWHACEEQVFVATCAINNYVHQVPQFEHVINTGILTRSNNKAAYLTAIKCRQIGGAEFFLVSFDVNENNLLTCRKHLSMGKAFVQSKNSILDNVGLSLASSQQTADACI